MKNKIKGLLFILIFMLTLSSIWTVNYVGGYCGNDPTTPSVVYSFIKHFDYDQYYWAKDYMFSTSNNSYVDWEDFSYYCGHGNQYRIGFYTDSTHNTSTYLNLSGAGGSSNGGWGDRFAKYVVLHSCLVIPTRLERADWSSGWFATNSVWKGGVRMIIGFRTSASVSNAPSIANDYGNRIKNGGYVLYSWFDAINANSNHPNGWDYASIIWHTDTNYDVYPTSISGKATDTVIHITYQY